MEQHRVKDGTSSAFIRIRAGSTVSELGLGDGIDPKYEKRRRDKEGRREKADHGAERLGSQMREAIGISTSLPSLPGLDRFAVSSVVYTGRGNCYSVLVYCVEPEYAYSPEDILETLKRNKGILRSHIARAIVRKRVPDLVFEVFPPGIRP